MNQRNFSAWIMSSQTKRLKPDFILLALPAKLDELAKAPKRGIAIRRWLSRCPLKCIAKPFFS